MSKIKNLIVGGAGFIGSAIADQLIDLNQEVIVIDNLSTGKKHNINDKCSFIFCDIANVDQSYINHYIKDIDVVFHCAALPNVQYSIDNAYMANKNNVDTTIKILEAMRINGVKKIIYSSSSSVYGDATSFPTTEQHIINPMSPYALQKYIGEEYCYLYNKIHGVTYTILRYFNVYGERMTDHGAYVSVLSHFLKSYFSNEPLNIVNDGEQTRDFIYVNDVAKANIMAASNDNSNNRIFNIGSGKNISINTIADWFNHPKQYCENRIEPKQTLADNTLAKDILKWQPIQELELWIKQQLNRKNK